MITDSSHVEHRITLSGTPFESIETSFGVGLCGYDNGKNIYQTQLMNKIDYSHPFVIRFPDTVNYMTMLFLDGMFSDIVSHIGLAGIGTTCKIIAPGIKQDASTFVYNRLVVSL